MFARVLPPGEGTQFPLTHILREKALNAILAVGEDKLIPYALLDEALGLPVQKDKRARTAILSIRRMLLRDHNYKLINVRDSGYRLARPNERAGISISERKRSQRILKGAY